MPCGLLIFFCIQLLPAFFTVQVFQSPDFSGSRFFRVQVFLSLGFSGSRFFKAQIFLSPGFSGSRFFRVRVQGLGPGFRSSQYFHFLTRYFGDTYHLMCKKSNSFVYVFVANCLFSQINRAR